MLDRIVKSLKAKTKKTISSDSNLKNQKEKSQSKSKDRI